MKGHTHTAIASLALASVLLFSLVGCTSGENPTGSQGKTQTSGTDGNVQTASPAPAPLEASVEEQVVVDQDGVRITVKELDLKGGFLGPELKLLIENDSDQTYIVQARDVSVNGLMVTGVTMSSEVAAGKKANDELTFLKSALTENGIDTFATIELKFIVADGENLQTVFSTPLITLETSVAGSYTQTYDDSGSALYEENGVRIVCRGLEEGGLMGPQIRLFIENSSDRDITVQVRDVSINGFMVASSMSSDVLAGKRANSGITLFSSDLEGNEIERVESAEFSFHIFDKDSWQTIADSDVLTVTF